MRPSLHALPLTANNVTVPDHKLDEASLDRIMATARSRGNEDDASPETAKHSTPHGAMAAAAATGNQYMSPGAPERDTMYQITSFTPVVKQTLRQTSNLPTTTA